MIYSIKGLVSHIEPNVAIIECNNIGFKCNISNNTAAKIKIHESCFLYTYMNVREDSLDLFGFFEEEELKYFKILIAVSGVGPKAAMSILSQFSPHSLCVAVATSDSKAISKTPGIGPKTAQRIILELKDKISLEDISENIFSENNTENIRYIKNSAFDEALEALKSLGYQESSIMKVIGKFDPNLKVEDVIKQALKEL